MNAMSDCAEFEFVSGCDVSETDGLSVCLGLAVESKLNARSSAEQPQEVLDGRYLPLVWGA